MSQLGFAFEEPVVVFTGDQDWAPSWAVKETFEVFQEAGVPFHLFATNEDSFLDAFGQAPGLTLGVHPNFLPGSTHGTDADSVVDHCLAMFPEARTARPHAFGESTYAMRALVKRSIHTVSAPCQHLQPSIGPLVHHTGLVQLPVFLEDDVMLDLHRGVPQLEVILPSLLQPGLKVFNFHPSLVASKVSAIDAWHEVKARGDLQTREVRFSGRGNRVLLQELFVELDRHGLQPRSFNTVADQVRRDVAISQPHLAQWYPSLWGAESSAWGP